VTVVAPVLLAAGCDSVSRLAFRARLAAATRGGGGGAPRAKPKLA
jgi:hypothetical protein